MTMYSSNSTLGLVDAEVSITIDTKEDVWVMIGEGMVMVIWLVKGEMFWIGATWEIEEKSEVEDSEDGKWRLTAGSGEKDTKTFLVWDDVDRVTNSRCKGILKIGASKITGSEMEVCTGSDVTYSGVDIKSWYNWDNAGDMRAPAGKVDKVWMDERSNVEYEQLETDEDCETVETGIKPFLPSSFNKSVNDCKYWSTSSVTGAEASRLLLSLNQPNR